MSEEERILRLENAFAALSELVAHSQEVDARHDSRLNTLAETNRLIVEMIRRHDERVDEFQAAREETEHKIAALVDAQIRIEEAHGRGMGELRASLAELAAVVKRLAESQSHTDRRLDGLIDIVRELRDGRG